MVSVPRVTRDTRVRCVRSRATDTNTFNYWEFDVHQRTRPAQHRRTTPSIGRVRGHFLETIQNLHEKFGENGPETQNASVHDIAFHLVTVTSVHVRCGGGDGAQRGPAPDIRPHLLRVRVPVQGEPLGHHGGLPPSRGLNNGMLFVSVFQIYLQTLQLPFEPF